MMSTGQKFVGHFGVSGGGLGGGWAVSLGYPDLSQSQNIYTGSDDVFWNHGKHAFKFGVLFNHYTQPLNLPIFVNGFTASNSNADFLRGYMSSLQETPPAANTNRDYLYNTYGFYGQDDVRLTHHFTVNLGLRYEFTGPIGMLDASTKSFAFRNFLSDAGSCVGQGKKDKRRVRWRPSGMK